MLLDRQRKRRDTHGLDPNAHMANEALTSQHAKDPMFSPVPALADTNHLAIERLRQRPTGYNPHNGSPTIRSIKGAKI